MSSGRRTMPSKAFSNSELAEAHGKLLSAKHEHESDDELDEKIQETIAKLFDTCGYLENVTIMFNYKLIWVQIHRYTSRYSIKPWRLNLFGSRSTKSRSKLSRCKLPNERRRHLLIGNPIKFECVLVSIACGPIYFIMF